MAAIFHEDGIRFQYPENWQLERQDTDHGWTVAVQSPQTAFLLVSFDGAMPDADQMPDSALEVLRTEYPDLEAEACLESVAGQPAVGHNIRFISLDLTNTCWSRSFVADLGTVHLFWQANDLELATLEPVLRAICTSLKLTED